jgi:hypothetical protein
MCECAAMDGGQARITSPVPNPHLVVRTVADSLVTMRGRNWL